MTSCPNKTSQEWKDLVSAVGDKNAMKLYLLNNETVVSPEVGQFQLFAETNPSIASEILEQNISADQKKNITQSTTLNDLMVLAGSGIYEDSRFLSKHPSSTYSIKESVSEPVFNALNSNLEEFLARFGFTTEQLEDLKDATGYSIIGATDFLAKTILVKKENIDKAYSKEAAYAIFNLLGKKNLLRKDLIASIHLIDNYDSLKSKYTNGKLSDYKIRELVAVDYLQGKLIEAHKGALPTSNKAVSKDVSAKNKLEYTILKIKQWWADIIRRFSKVYKKEYIDDVFNQIANDVINKNTRLFNLSKNISYNKMELSGKQKEINDNLVKIGAINSGSYALNRQGTLTRESIKDLDYFVPYYKRNNLIKDLIKLYPEIIFSEPYAGVMGNRSMTMSAKIGDVKLDFFLSNTPEEDSYNKIIIIDGVKYHHWKNIFDAKVRIGSQKHLSDLAGFVPFNKEWLTYDITREYSKKDVYLNIIGQRHYNFDFVQSKFNKATYSSDRQVQEVSNTAQGSGTQDSKQIESYFANNGIDYRKSNQYNDLLSYFKNDKDKALNAYYITFSENFKKFYGNIDSRKFNSRFSLGEVSGDYSKNSVLLDENNEPIIFYHGAGTIFDKFSKDYFLSGEGAMAYGAGFYSTNYKPTADNYRDTAKAAMNTFNKLLEEQDQRLLDLMKRLKVDVTEKRLISFMQGSFSKVDKKDRTELLNLLGLTETKALYLALTNPLYWEKPISSENKKLIEDHFKVKLKSDKGGDVYRELEKSLKISDKEVSARLYQIGIDGIIRFAGGGVAVGGFSHKRGEKHVIFFEPVQAKAVNNSGIFALNNENMYDPIQIDEKAQKLEEIATEFTEQTSLTPELNTLDILKNAVAINNLGRANEIAYKMAVKLSNQTGIPFQVVSPEEATTILAGSQTPYRNQPAFFYGGKAYFISGRMTLGTVFHEFAHPIVGSIRLQNRALFEKLYNDVAATPEGKMIIEDVANQYPQLEGRGDLFMEEVIVHALEYNAQKNQRMEKALAEEGFSEKFVNAVKEILYQIKQALRKAFGKVRVQDLKADTTLDELADMLTNSEFQIEIPAISYEDIAMFAETQVDYVNEIVKEIDQLSNKPEQGRQKLQEILDKMYVVVSKEKQKTWSSQEESAYVDKMAATLKRVKSIGLSHEQALMHEKLTTAQRAVSFISTLKTMEAASAVILKNFENTAKEDIEEMMKNDSDYIRRSLTNSDYHANLLKEWRTTLAAVKYDMMDAGITANNPVSNLIYAIEGRINAGLDKHAEIQKQRAAAATEEWLQEYKNNIDKRYNDRINMLEEALKKSPDSSYLKNELKEMREEFIKFQVTKERIADLYSGNIKDADWFNAMLEAYTNSTDPIVGGFAVFLKNNLTRLQNNAIKKQKEFREKLMPKMRKLGINNNDLKSSWGFAITEDKTYAYEDGKLVERKTLSFLSAVKDWRYAIRKFEYDIEDLKKRIAKAQLEGLSVEETKKELKEKQKEFQKHKNEFFWQEYKTEVYEALDKLFDETVTIDGEIYNAGLEAWAERNEKLSEIALMTGKRFTESELYDIHGELAQMSKDLAQLYSLYNLDHTPKTGKELAKAQALLNHRERTSKFYKYIDIKGAFNEALNAYEQEILTDNPGISSDEFKAKVDKWIGDNTKVGYTDEYYQDMTNAFNRLKELQAQLSEEALKGMDPKDLYSRIAGIVKTYTDDTGEPQASQVSPADKDKIKELQEELNEFNTKFLPSTGLSINETLKYNGYMAIIENGESLSPEDKEEYLRLMEKAEKNALTEDQLEIKREIASIMGGLFGKAPTKEYVQTLNDQLKMAGLPMVGEEDAAEIGKRKTEEFEGNFAKYIPAERLMEKSANFKDWFMKNHVKKEYYNPKTKKKEYIYERLRIWSTNNVTEDKYLQKMSFTRLVNPATGATETVTLSGRTADMRFKLRVVKDEFRTIPWELNKKENKEKREKFLRENGIQDNKGNFLPKNKDWYIPKAGVNNPYINEDYYKLQKERKEHFELLQDMTKYHLDNQIGTDYDSKLYLDLPRFRMGNRSMDTMEQVSSGVWFNEKKKTWEKVASGIKTTLSGGSVFEANQASVEDRGFEIGLEAPTADAMTPMDFMRIATAGSYRDRIPVEGVNFIAPDLQSRNIPMILDMYMLSAENQRGLNEIQPIANALQDVLSDPSNSIKENGANKSQINAMVARTLSKDDQKNMSVRAAAVKSLYDRTFKGQIFSEKHLDWVNKATGLLMKGASFSYFALNLPSAIKNSWGAKWQMNMLALAGEHMDIGSYGQAKVWSKKATMDWMSNIYAGDKYTLSNMLIMYFDPLQGKMEEVFGTHGTRTIQGDIMSLSWAYSPRKYMEFEAALQLFGGMMYHKKIPMKNKDGSVTQISYMDAWEAVGPEEGPKELKLKEGIDKEYDINGKEYMKFRNLMNETSKDLNGAFAKFEQPQAQAYFTYRLVTFMRRYFTTMFMNRFAKKRANFAINDVKRGFYIQSVLTIGKILQSFGEHVHYMEESEKIALKKIATEAGQIIAISAIAALVFGYDDDDPERFAKMEDRSGAIGSDNFNLPGFLGNHLLTLLLKTQNENETFIPLPGFGLNDYTRMMNVTSIAFGPTITSYGKIITDIAMHAAPGEDPSLFYKRDVGPYPWQREESAKIWNHIGAMLGLTGSDIDPTKAMRSFSSVQNKWN